MDIRSYLAEHDLTEEKLAVKVGCSQSMINKLKRHTVSPSLDLMRLIAEATNGAVTPNDFMPTTPQVAA